MDAFENLVAMLLRRQGYWTSTSVKVELTKEEKRKIERLSCPRWEIDVVAFKASTNTVLAIECKSFLDSRGVRFETGTLKPERRYKLFTSAVLRGVVLKRLRQQLIDGGMCGRAVKVSLGLAVGKLAGATDVDGLRRQFHRQKWYLYEPEWINEQLRDASLRGYENDMAYVVSKLLLR